MKPSASLQEQIRSVGREIWKACAAAVLAFLLVFVAEWLNEIYGKAKEDPYIYEWPPEHPFSPWLLYGFWICLLFNITFLIRAWRLRFPAFLPNRYVLPLFVAGCAPVLTCLGVFLWLLMGDDI